MFPSIQSVLEALGEGNLYERGKLQQRGSIKRVCFRPTPRSLHSGNGCKQCLYVCSTGGTIFGWLVFHCPNGACMLSVCSEQRIRYDHLRSFPSYRLHFVECFVPHISMSMKLFCRNYHYFESISEIRWQLRAVLVDELLLLAFGSFVNGMASVVISFPLFISVFER